MSFEIVQINAGGYAYGGFTSVSIEAAANGAAWSFDFSTNDPASESWSIPTGEPCTITASGTPMIVGYVEDFEPSFSGDDVGVQLSGRSKSLDLIECSAVHDTGRFENKTALQIANELDKFGVGFSSDVQLEPVPWFQIRQGETVLSALDRLLKDQGYFIQGMPDGSAKITKGAKGGRQPGALVQGQNMKAGRAKHTSKGRFSDYTVKGQSALGTGTEATQPTAKAKDSGVKRYRPKIIVNEGETDTKRAKTRAKTAASRSAGLSEGAEVTVAGWRIGGQIIIPNRLVYVQSSRLRIDGDMLIKSVRFNQSDDGTTATVSLVDPRSLGGDKKGGGKSDAGSWADYEIEEE